MSKTTSGFTIVELLVVIIIIAILATISVLAYSNTQRRTNDSKRMSDVNALQKALAQYRIINGSFPATVPNPGSSTWEISSDPNFMNSLSSITGGATFAAPGINNSANVYWYHRFNAGDYGCPASLGPYYILWVKGMQTQNGSGTISTNGCTNQTMFDAAGGWTTNQTHYIYYGFSSS